MPGPIKVMLLREPESNEGLVSLKGPKEEGSKHYRFKLPWYPKTEWQAVFLSLELLEKDPKTWPQGKVRQKAQALRLFLPDRPSDDRFEIIGRRLYDAVFCSEEIRSVLDRLLHPDNEMPVIEFHIEDEDSRLQAYPWELLHNGKRFLFEGYHAFPVRHIHFDEPITQLELTEALTVLYIAPRPDMSSHKGYANLPILEKCYLEDLNRRFPDHLALKSLPDNTLDALHRYLIDSSGPTHVVHIDAHGGFGWLCHCKRLNPPSAEQCYQCEKPRSKDQRNRGYLAFGTDDGDIDWVSGDDLGKRLYRRDVQVVVLSACRSGLVGGASAFNSVAGALIKNRIPAVVAMQFSVDVKQAKKFVEFFYGALMNGMPLTQATAEARQAMSDDSWYRPVLYLRTDSGNYRGAVFRSPNPLAQELLEWKLIHHKCQELIEIFRGGPLEHLQECINATNSQQRNKWLNKAATIWERDCIPRLKGIPGKWHLRRVQPAEVAELKNSVSNAQTIYEELMMIDPQDRNFRARVVDVNQRALHLNGILWNLLGRADSEIRKLIETLHPEDRIP